MKRARLVRGAFINADDEPSEHQKRREIMNDVTHGDEPTWYEMVEPHQQAGDEKQHAAKHNQPEVDLLATIKKADVLSLNSVAVSGVLPEAFDPTAIGAG